MGRPIPYAAASGGFGARASTARGPSTRRAVRHQLNPRCTWGTGRNNSDKGAYSTPAGIARHVGQMISSMQCLTMLISHEETHGIRFDYVTRSRPDLGYLAPVKPHCALFFPEQQPVAHVDVSLRAAETGDGLA